MSIIIALSGGKASAWCADWALRTYPKDDILLYFNDTKWEHEDLYRFLSDLSEYWSHPIVFDSDGRNPEQLFYDHHALANNRMPFCSRILKAERLQKYYKDGDTLVFGIGASERHRANRLIAVYESVATKTGRWPKLTFPLIGQSVTSREIDEWLHDIGIQEPLLYRLGFSHNNCSGGCVRAGKKHWKLLLEKLPEVYAERERVERQFREYVDRDVHFLRDETLESFRRRMERQLPLFDDDDDKETDCIGICGSIA